MRLKTTPNAALKKILNLTLRNIFEKELARNTIIRFRYEILVIRGNSLHTKNGSNLRHNTLNAIGQWKYTELL